MNDDYTDTLDFDNNSIIGDIKANASKLFEVRKERLEKNIALRKSERERAKIEKKLDRKKRKEEKPPKFPHLQLAGVVAVSYAAGIIGYIKNFTIKKWRQHQINKEHKRALKERNQYIRQQEFEEQYRETAERAKKKHVDPAEEQEFFAEQFREMTERTKKEYADPAQEQDFFAERKAAMLEPLEKNKIHVPGPPRMDDEKETEEEAKANREFAEKIQQREQEKYLAERTAERKAAMKEALRNDKKQRRAEARARLNFKDGAKQKVTAAKSWIARVSTKAAHFIASHTGNLSYIAQEKLDNAKIWGLQMTYNRLEKKQERLIERQQAATLYQAKHIEAQQKINELQQMIGLQKEEIAETKGKSK